MEDFLTKWQTWIFAALGFVIWLVRLEMKTKFNEQNVIKLNMDNRKQFEVMGKSLEKVEGSVFSLGNKIESSVCDLIASVNELKGIVSTLMKRGR